MNIRKLSIIIPAYNEANTIAQLLYGVVNAPLPSGIEKEIIIIDDCSTDNTALQVRNMLNRIDAVLLEVLQCAGKEVFL